MTKTLASDLQKMHLTELMSLIDSRKLVQEWRANFPVQYALPFPNLLHCKG